MLKQDKGGIKSKPTTPKPNIKPPGQKSKVVQKESIKLSSYMFNHFY